MGASLSQTPPRQDRVDQPETKYRQILGFVKSPLDVSYAFSSSHAVYERVDVIDDFLQHPLFRWTPLSEL